MKTEHLREPPLRLWRIPRLKYECMVIAGAFEPEDRVELLDGLLVVLGMAGAGMAEPGADLAGAAVSRPPARR